MTTVVIPFVRPETPVEVLERTLEWAKDEERWVSGQIFEVLNKPRTCPAENLTGRPCDNVGACLMGIIIAVTFNGPAVDAHIKTDLKYIEFDPTYMVNPPDAIPFTVGENFSVTEGMVQYYPPAAEATMFLASALNPRMGKFQGSIQEAVTKIISFNDAAEAEEEAYSDAYYEYAWDEQNENRTLLTWNEWIEQNKDKLQKEFMKSTQYKSQVPTRFGDIAHHQKIVKAVEDALVLARKDAA